MKSLRTESVWAHARHLVAVGAVAWAPWAAQAAPMTSEELATICAAAADAAACTVAVAPPGAIRDVRGPARPVKVLPVLPRGSKPLAPDYERELWRFQGVG